MKIKFSEFNRLIIIILFLITIQNYAKGQQIVCYGEEIRYTFPICTNKDNKFLYSVTNGTFVIRPPVSTSL